MIILICLEIDSLIWRKYTPVLLKSLEFRSTIASEPLIRALETLKEMNESEKEKYQMRPDRFWFQNVGRNMFMMKKEQ